MTDFLDLGDLLNGGAPFVDAAANDQSDTDRLIAIMTQMQEGINALTDIVATQKAQITALQVEVRRLKARTDAPAKSSIIRPN